MYSVLNTLFIFFQTVGHVRHIYSHLERCEQAISLLYHMEKKLYDDSVINLGATNIVPYPYCKEAQNHSNKSLFPARINTFRYALNS